MESQQDKTKDLLDLGRLPAEAGLQTPLLGTRAHGQQGPSGAPGAVTLRKRNSVRTKKKRGNEMTMHGPNEMDLISVTTLTSRMNSISNLQCLVLQP